MCCTSITHGIDGSANAMVAIKAHHHYKDNLMVNDLCIWHIPCIRQVNNGPSQCP